MVAIHGAVFFIIGIIVTGFSIYFNNTLSTEDNQPFLLFIYLGIFFMLLGLFKWLWPHIKEGKEKKSVSPVHHAANKVQHPMQHPTHQSHNQMQHPMQAQHHAMHQGQMHPSSQMQHQPHSPTHPGHQSGMHTNIVQQRQQPTSQHTYTVHYCPGCRSPLEPHHNYCSHCGGRIR